jgi:hypothetical protein
MGRTTRILAFVLLALSAPCSLPFMVGFLMGIGPVPVYKTESTEQLLTYVSDAQQALRGTGNLFYPLAALSFNAGVAAGLLTGVCFMIWLALSLCWERAAFTNFATFLRKIGDDESDDAEPPGVYT